MDEDAAGPLPPLPGALPFVLRLLPDTHRRTACLLLALPFVAALVVLLAPTVGVSRVLASDLAMALAALVPVAFALANARGGAPAAQRRPWLLLGIAWGLWFLGDVAWAWSEWRDGLGVLQRWPNLLYLAHYPVFVMALLRLARLCPLCADGDAGTLAPEDRLPLALDVAVVTLAVAAMEWHLIGAPLLDDAIATPASIAGRLMAPLFSLVATIAATVVLFRHVRSRERAGLALLAIGVFLGLAAGIATSRAEGSPTRSETRWPELLYIASYAVFGLGALRLRTVDAVPLARAGERLVRTMLPMGVTALLFVHLLVDAVDGAHPAPALIAAATAIVPLIYLQQYLTSRRLHTTMLVQACSSTEARFRTIVQHASDMIAVLDADERIQYATPSLARLLGLDAGALVGLPLVSLLPDEDVPRFRALLTATLPGTPAAQGAWRLRPTATRARMVEATVENLLDDATVRGIVVTMHDVTERTTLAAELRHRSYHDELTGLANRTQFTVRLANALGRSDGGDRPVVTALIGLDGFQQVNDSLGHSVGDALRRQAAERVRTVLRDGDAAARLGDDEFGVLFAAGTSQQVASALVAQLLEALQAPYALRGREAIIGAAAGLACGTIETGGEEVMRHADLALARALDRGAGTIEWFTDRLHADALDRVELIADLRQAVEFGQLHFEYQPIVDLGTGATRGLEALVRWNHPRRGPVSPGVFIPLAEQSGLIVPIGRFVLRSACTMLRAWLRLAGESAQVTVTVNLSPRQLGDAGLVDDVRSAIADAELPAGRLVLELTESTLLQKSDETLRLLQALKAAGTRLALDDFGTGYSSLSYLRTYPVDILKLDKSFVDDVATDVQSAAVARAVIKIGEALGLRVIAEGVQDAAQREALRDIGCTFGQGFLFARPMPAPKVIALLQTQAGVSVPETAPEPALA